ncbi:uncharacterized protein K460DRAFT_402716 [Cucurbitaria berberidis CBS 394.84]|uniref:Uncharacterized protein n=1 Tax=Cucurbitaria berberidis CBS 394.84 TaxID=1168544 RepID=A0A9P4LAM7_9PLEO|nr:uncharacterized protein K460DRAFT_402716 [Cucurbitaria berberidis CBS 394.84]KAF1847354.1 hypothetical protein K460DRAFT_402716 [Cucurbitaria berberidis CBS 394.84]
MPQVYLIVRFDSTDQTKPPYRTAEVTSIDTLPSPQGDQSRIVKTIRFTDPSTFNTYSIAIEVVKKPGRDFKIIYTTTSLTEAQQKIAKIPDFVSESDTDRRKHYSYGFTKAQVTQENENCVRIKLKKTSFCWFELVTVDFGDATEEEGVAEDVDIVDKGRDKKKRKVEVKNGGEKLEGKGENIKLE